MKTIPNQKQLDHAGCQQRLLIVDDHPIFRRGIAMLIEHEPDFVICGEAETAAQAMQLAERLAPDLVITDISLKDVNGIELVKSLKAMYPHLPVLVLSMHDESLYAERALRAGARGYLMKQAPPDQVVTAIRQVLRGELHLSSTANFLMLNAFASGQRDKNTSSIEQLSDRELEIFELLGQGRGTSMIAHDLHVSVKTIEAHRAHIKTKLGLSTAPQLVRAAVEWVTQREAGRRTT
ncbi:response regulator transcription factor [Prosthecobacter sp.]|uniref:response regulator transcription factor n=1 Tax=Prosthecobacter sp. TaxID=1965333 RepID=UPI002ABCC4B4|nr:response regulator transcription factor [Prosthecobacter sp.]MDZ4405383.1 response regulator transcription factor [Prosthecobacter sp.]